MSNKETASRFSIDIQGQYKQLVNSVYEFFSLASCEKFHFLTALLYQWEKIHDKFVNFTSDNKLYLKKEYFMLDLHLQTIFEFIEANALCMADKNDYTSSLLKDIKYLLICLNALEENL